MKFSNLRKAWWVLQRAICFGFPSDQKLPATRKMVTHCLINISSSGLPIPKVDPQSVCNELFRRGSLEWKFHAKWGCTLLKSVGIKNGNFLFVCWVFFETLDFQICLVCHLQTFLNIAEGNKVETTPATPKVWIQASEIT